MASIFCTQCGHQNPADARFCARCGAQLSQGAPVPGDATTTISLSALESEEHADAGEHAGTDAPGESLPPGTAMLVVRRGPNAGSRFLLDKDVTTVGRHPDSDIFLDDVTVSRRHAEFRRADGRFHVVDAGSLNGTYVDRERIDDAELTSGAEVQIGKFRLLFFAASAAS